MSAKIESLPLHRGISLKVRMIALAVLVALVAVVASIVVVRVTSSSTNVRPPTAPTQIVNQGSDQEFRIGDHFVK